MTTARKAPFTLTLNKINNFLNPESAEMPDGIDNNDSDMAYLPLKKLSARITTLIRSGLTTTGEYDEALEYIAEDLTPQEYYSLQSFFYYLQLKKLEIGRANYHERYATYLSYVTAGVEANLAPQPQPIGIIQKPSDIESIPFKFTFSCPNEKQFQRNLKRRVYKLVAEFLTAHPDYPQDPSEIIQEVDWKRQIIPLTKAELQKNEDQSYTRYSVSGTITLS